MASHRSGKSKLAKCDPVREAAVEALILIEQGEKSETALKSVAVDRDFRPIDRRFLMQLTNGATKMRRRLDHEMKFFLAKPSQELPLKLSNILRLGLFQIRFNDRVPDAAAVSESVNLARTMLDDARGRMVNAVLRASLREPHRVKFADQKSNPVKYLADFYSFPDYFVKYCLDEFGLESARRMLEQFNRRPLVTFRVNILKVKIDEVAKILSDAGVEFSHGKYLPEFLRIDGGGLPLEEELLGKGKVIVQDESAGLPTRLLNPRPKSEVVDLTAAPGGKATHLAIRMRNQGQITAVDKSHARLKLVEENARRLGIKIIAPVACDMMEFEGGPFDRVLLDPPCSGWGTAGRHSDLRWAKTSADIDNLVTIQKAMIDRAARLVKPGGIMVYSTCTIVRRENDQIVEEFLLKHKDFEIDSAEEFFPADIVSERGFVKTYPDCPPLDGAFCARLRRKK